MARYNVRIYGYQIEETDDDGNNPRVIFSFPEDPKTPVAVYYNMGYKTMHSVNHAMEAVVHTLNAVGDEKAQEKEKK